MRRRAAVALTILSAALPVSLVAALLLLSWRGAFLLGHWPDAFREAAPTLGGDDPLYRSLFRLIDRLLFFPLPASLLLCPVGLLLYGERIRRRRALVVAALYAAGWVLLLTDPLARLAWFFG